MPKMILVAVASAGTDYEWQDSKVCPPPMDQRTILGCWNGSILSCYWDRELGAWMVSGYNIKRNPDYWAELYTPAAPEKEDKG